MKTLGFSGWALGICITLAALGAGADETTGKVKDTGFGKFTLDEKGMTREFNLSSTKSQYEPASWRPTVQDTVKVAFTVNQGKRGTVLAVDKVSLLKAGPNTVASIESPVTVELTEVGKTGVRAKLPSGQIAKLSFQRSTQRLPAGWIPAVGEKARIECHAQPTMVFTVSFVIDKIERVGGPEK